MTQKVKLSGIKEIQTCCGRLGLPTSVSSVISMINHDGFPAKKIGGIWISDMNLIEEWRLSYIKGVVTVKNDTKKIRK